MAAAGKTSRWVYAFLLLAAAVLPAAVALLCATARFGSGGEAVAFSVLTGTYIDDEVTVVIDGDAYTRVLRRPVQNAAAVQAQAVAPSCWPMLSGGDERAMLGVTVRKFKVLPRTPGGWYADVALWQIRAGWPFPCLEAYWKQDFRYKRAPLFVNDLAEPPEPTFWEQGMHYPSSFEERPGDDWLPVRPMLRGYLANALLYYAVLLGLAALWRKVWRTVVVKARKHKSRCVHCGYSVAGLKCPQCPECGSHAHKDTSVIGS